MIHRDVKPSNIMLETRGKDQAPSASKSRQHFPRLMDFGLAKRDAGDITMTTEGQVLGTPAYMSPEQARGESTASPTMRSGSMASITRARWIAQSKCRTGQTSASSSGIWRNAALNQRTPGDPPSAKGAEVVDSGYFQKKFRLASNLRSIVRRDSRLQRVSRSSNMISCGGPACDRLWE